MYLILFAGQLLSIEFAKLGSLVIGWDINKNGLEETKKKLAEKGISSQWQSFVCDISDREQVYNTAKKVSSQNFQKRVLKLTFREKCFFL